MCWYIIKWQRRPGEENEGGISKQEAPQYNLADFGARFIKGLGRTEPRTGSRSGHLWAPSEELRGHPHLHLPLPKAPSQCEVLEAPLVSRDCQDTSHSQCKHTEW